MIRHSFAPFGRPEITLLQDLTRIDYSSTDFSQPSWLCASAYEDDHLLGVCCFEFKMWFDAYFTIAIHDPRCITRRAMRAVFTAVFSTAVRVTADIEPWNERALRQARLMGFEIEGFRVKSIEGRRDAYTLGMTKDTCRYLRARPEPSLSRMEGIRAEPQST